MEEECESEVVEAKAGRYPYESGGLSRRAAGTTGAGAWCVGVESALWLTTLLLFVAFHMEARGAGTR